MGVFLSEIGKIIATQHYEEQWVPLSESYRKVFETTSAYWVTSIDELKILLENRVSNLNGSLLLVGGICGLILLCSLFLSVSLFKTICIPLERLVSVIQDVKNGRLMVEFPVIYYKDELHLINEELQKLYQVILESFRLKTGLERVGAGLMMTRANHEIIYINPALQKIFNLYEPIISKHMPGFNEFLNGIYVQSFNDFTTHPLNEAEGVGKILCTFEHVVFEIEANTIINHHGEELGFVFEWVDKTQEIKIQHEIEQMVLSAIEGNLTTHISVNDKQGFMLTLSEHINQFVTTIYSSLRDLKSLLSALSQGNLRYRLSGNYGGIFQEIQTDANATAEQLNLMVKAIVSSTDVITSAIEDMSLATDDLSKRTEKQASDLAVASNAMEDLSCTVNQNATNSKRANRFGKESHVVAEKGTNAVLQVAQTMQSIEESSQKIKDIMTLIDDIAFQTNLLALNAAVEAARAGTAGKGFAVVADEVRTLSQRCAEASKQVKVIISKSTNQVEDGVRLVEKARENLKEILHVTQEVALIIKEITYASDKQSSQLDEVRELVDSVDKETKKNVAMVDQGKMISITLQDQADRLSKSLGRFKV
jgi:methyl-accepting chemotaxis protein